MSNAPVIAWSKGELSAIRRSEASGHWSNCLEPISQSYRYVVLGVHGVGIVSDFWISNLAEAQTYFSSIGEINFNELGSTIRGSLTIYVWDNRNSELIVLTDPLGAGIVFVYSGQSIMIVSSSLNDLIDVCSKRGYEPKKSLAYVSSYVATGSGGLVGSSYQNIDSLGQFEYLVISADSFARNRYSAKSLVYDGLFDYEQLLNEVVEEVNQNVRISLNHENQVRVAHLTGGLDSRLVLGSIISQGLESEFAFYCSGNDKEPDQQVARGISARLGLTMTRHSGVVPSVLSSNLREQLLSPLQETGGIIGGPANGNLSLGNMLVLSGGYGELLRSFYSKGYDFEGDVRSAAAKIFGSVGFNKVERHALLSKSGIDATVSGMETLLGQAAEAGLDQDRVLDSLYFTARNRYFVGEISRSLSPYVSRFDPLYSLALARLGLHGDLALKTFGIIGLDLLNKFDSTLISLPFDSDRLSEKYLSLRGPVHRIEFDGIPPHYDGNEVASISSAGKNSILRPSSDDISRANVLRTSPRLVAQNSEVRSRLRNFLSNFSDSDLSAGFNPTVIRKFVDVEPTHRVHLRTAMKLYASLEWFFDEKS